MISDDKGTIVGRAFGTPLVVKGLTWFPVVELVVWAVMTWLAGKKSPRRPGWQRLGVGALTTLVILGSEWCHNLAHAAAAHWVKKPMDAIRIVGGMPLVVYYNIQDASVTPKQHVVRAMGGPTGVLLSHGYTATCWEVRMLADNLHARGYTVAGPLLSGHGSKPEDLNRARWQDWADTGEKVYQRLQDCPQPHLRQCWRQMLAAPGTCRQRLWKYFELNLREERTMLGLSLELRVQAIHRPHIQARLQAYYGQYFELLVAFFQHGIESGELRPVSPHTAAAAVLALYDGLLQGTPQIVPANADAHELDELVHKAFDLFFDGLECRS